MATTVKTKHISVTVSISSENVYTYLSDPKNFPEWASGLCKSISPIEGNEWLIDSPMGLVKVRFSEKNSFGVLDHYVTLSPDNTVYNPMRVLANAEGSEVVFTLFQVPGMSDEKFQEDSEWVLKDLNKLKELMEKKFS